MSDTGKNVKHVFFPGFWKDTDNDLHFDPVTYLNWRGDEVTEENVSKAEETFKEFARKINPTRPIVDVFDK